jgi:hypothetical protein
MRDDDTRAPFVCCDAFDACYAAITTGWLLFVASGLLLTAVIAGIRQTLAFRRMLVHGVCVEGELENAGH